MSSARRLADMSQHPPSFEYCPPRGGEQHEYPIQLDEHHELRVRMHLYQGMVVDFAFVQRYTGEEFPVEVARVDCCHGEVHVHQFGRLGGQIDRTVLHTISREEPWKTVDEWFYSCNEAWCVPEEWERRYRRWETS